MKSPRLASTLAVLLGLLSITSAARAETLYVSDRFEIGVHDTAALDSVIVAVVPSGTPLTVLGRNGEFVQVQTPDGIKGWVDARYVVVAKHVGVRPLGNEFFLRACIINFRSTPDDARLAIDAVVELGDAMDREE